MATSPSGVKGYDDGRFWGALFLYCVSIVLFFEHQLSWSSFYVVMPGLIAFVIVSSIAWDYRIIGNPKESFCCILHAAFFVAMVFFLNRLVAVGLIAGPLVETPVVSGNIIGVVMRLPIINQVLGLFSVVWDNLGLCVVLFLVSFAVIFKRAVALSLLAIVGLIVLLLAVGKSFEHSTGTVASLLAGVAAMTAAFKLQRVDERRNLFWNHVAARLRPTGPRPALDMTVKINLLRRLFEAGALGEREIRGVVAGSLDCASDDPRLKAVCGRALDQMIAQEGLAEARDGSGGQRLVLAVPDCESDFFFTCARVLRAAIILIFALLYVLSPVDLVPDAIPMIGLIDDMAIGVVGILSSVRTYQQAEARPERVLPGIPFR